MEVWCLIFLNRYSCWWKLLFIGCYSVGFHIFLWFSYPRILLFTKSSIYGPHCSVILLSKDPIVYQIFHLWAPLFCDSPIQGSYCLQNLPSIGPIVLWFAYPRILLFTISSIYGPHCSVIPLFKGSPSLTKIRDQLELNS